MRQSTACSAMPLSAIRSVCETAQRFSVAINLAGKNALSRRDKFQSEFSDSWSHITFAAHLQFLFFPPQTTTLKAVKRLYTIGRIAGGMKFTCTHCAHHVSTLDFDPRDGNLRTQAARAINQHATQVHHEPVTYSSLDSQVNMTRV
jgi:hypothetical protein